MRTTLFFLLSSLFLVGCHSPETNRDGDPESGAQTGTLASVPDLDSGRLEVATFAGGCFWCMQPPFDKLDGVKSTLVGYTDGPEEGPTYEDVSRGRTGHAEAVEIIFDPEVITYDELLHAFWRSIDPTTVDRQFADIGPHYRTGIYYHNETQRELARASKVDLEANGPFDKPIVTPIVEASTFWIAEENHQQYYLKNPRHYQSYYVGSGRAGFLERTWGER